MKQKNKIQLLLVAAFASLSVMCYAQGKVCAGITYDIVSLQDPSDPSSYQWMEDGTDISGAVAAAYTVPSSKEVGKYTYIRRSMKAGCDWASSNVYTVEVLDCKTELTGEGDKGVMTDPRDSKVYKIVKMPDGKVWMAENLNYQSGLTFNQYSNQANGQPYTNTENGVPAIGSFWCPPLTAGAGTVTASTNKNTCNVYGALYTWETAMSTDGLGVWNESTVEGRYASSVTPPSEMIGDPTDIRGICPTGWHLPTDYEWATLLDAVDTKASSKYVNQSGTGLYGSIGVAGSEIEGANVKMKSASTYIGTDPSNGAWSDHANRGNDATGFGAVPAGSRTNNGSQFADRGTIAIYWSSSVSSSRNSWRRGFNYGTTQVTRNNSPRSNGFSVRCVKD
jgi:uncharacterized protein (TIGR02145 family)